MSQKSFKCRASFCQLAFLIIFPITLTILSPAALAETDYSDPVYSQQRQRFIEDCRTAKYNRNCARFFKAQNVKRKSKEFCSKNLEDPGCSELLEQKDTAEEGRLGVSAHRELAKYCQVNQKAPRCASKARQRSRHKIIY